MNFWDDLDAQRERDWQAADVVELRKKLARRQSKCCYWCQGQMAPGDRTLDHILPHSLGGPYVLSNLVLAHQNCNERRGSHFNDQLLERLSDSVLRLAIKNLQALPISAYEDGSEKQNRVLKARQEMETKVLTLLARNLLTRHAEYSNNMETSWAKRREEHKQASQRRREAYYLKLLEAFRTGAVGKRIRRYEKKEKLVSSFLSIPRKEVTEIRCRRSAKVTIQNEAG